MCLRNLKSVRGVQRRNKRIPEIKWGDQSLNLSVAVFRSQATE